MPHHPQKKAEVRKLRYEGKSIRQIAALTGVSRAVVGTWVKPENLIWVKKCALCEAEFTTTKVDRHFCRPSHARKYRSIYGAYRSQLIG